MKIRWIATALSALALSLGVVAPAFANPGAPSQGAAGALSDEVARRPVSMVVKSATAEEVSAQLTALAGVPIVYVPAKAEDVLSMQASDMPLGEVVAELAKRGAVAIGGQPVTLPSGSNGAAGSRKVSLDVKGLDAPALSRILGTLLETEVEFKPRSADFRLNLDVKNMPVDELVQTLRQLGDLTLQASRR